MIRKLEPGSNFESESDSKPCSDQKMNSNSLFLGPNITLQGSRLHGFQIQIPDTFGVPVVFYLSNRGCFLFFCIQLLHCRYGLMKMSCLALLKLQIQYLSMLLINCLEYPVSFLMGSENPGHKGKLF